MNRFVLSAILLCQVHGLAQPRPQPPCGEDPVPPYPELDHSPVVTFWSESELGREWRAPPCAGWNGAGFSTVITTVARFRNPLGADELLRRIGAVSEMAGTRYWSITHQQWRTLIMSAHALTVPHAGHRRADFNPSELLEGKVLNLEQADNLAGNAIYRMHMSKASANRIVFDVENVTSLRYFFVTLFPPGEMQSIYFLDREGDGVWRYYGMVRTGRNASRLATGHEASSVNRAVAFYRWLAGIPTDQEPPAAR